ncbi:MULTISPECIES: precorrin-4 C(11)-methyltransferase [Bacteroides]|uniref:Precorrin-4 C(11)-methyltransferase n=3 Tax=Bacteroides TaxID=816 RepID=A0AAP9NAQ4_BACFG|nr:MULTISPECIES: precorrin-4 C(11)-methyltransferase [Bacteroides]EFR53347.1 precorrin-4 C(11)-methyltransferase [Bacteroides fragilis 3_1_12]MBM6511653.1 precorrin-4 C(11)-methyltransferase [Bacteroides fragilis]MDV6165305.1 precorrin-4 C(11)-methyltransferase [Bacteroides hominis (ex Liu et al. 2022)]OCL18470.1 cobalamin biosynthesis protein CbiG [Bacteroides fragilis]OCM96497.1 cobalamin biosynthesis protein CbiG [Bacteroides fragilis]
MKTAIIVISEASISMAKTLKQELPESEIVSTIANADCRHIPALQEAVPQLFRDSDALIFIGAMGICVRAIAPCIEDKKTDPAVLCVDSTGRYVISVLSGHVGGANGLTQYVAGILGAEPVITTRSDRTGLWALDTLGKKYDWQAIPSENCDMNHLISLFVDCAPTALLLDIRDEGTAQLEHTLPSHVDVFYNFKDIDTGKYRLLLLVTPYLYETSGMQALYYVPKVLHMGMGLARNAGPKNAVITRLMNTLLEANIIPAAIRTISSIEEKKHEEVLKLLADAYELHLYTASQLSQVDVPTPSEVVDKYMGTPSVSEASALLTAGGGPLILPKQKCENFTVAIALDSAAVRQGHIEIVGAGPGDPELISVRGRRFLEEADLILYAGSLVPHELTECAKAGATIRSSAPMTLEEQFALMKDFYDRGQLVVRLHTGDPCIYGAIQEQMNFFDRYGMRYHITPGISSFQAAAAALQSQFTIPEKVQTIILTRGEGRTPMPEKEKLSLLARSQSTMCIFLSAGVIDQVQQELLEHYPPTTPVAACYHLTWKDERIYRGELKDLAQIVKENNLTLTTMIVVGDAIDNREGLSRLYSHQFKHLFRK